ncbi:hypothetical protein [Rickettsia endosymbiont of Halotydeus destructor]|uniref:hypothetical protein n=1 Tax=Rickettsia endosymbiont of Halotydeus destructor TaxID=2996754 RepID=UPI003BAE4ED9
MKYYGIGDYGPERWLLVTILFAAIVITKPKILTTKTIVSMGCISYSFYLLHAMVIFAVFWTVSKLYILDITMLSKFSFSMLNCIAFILATFLSTISYLYIERPFMHLK